MSRVAGFVACSATNPIWLVKTRLQLDHNADGRPMTAKQVVQRVYRLGVSITITKMANWQVQV